MINIFPKVSVAYIFEKSCVMYSTSVLGTIIVFIFHNCYYNYSRFSSYQQLGVHFSNLVHLQGRTSLLNLYVQIKHSKWTAKVASFFYPKLPYAQLHAHDRGLCLGKQFIPLYTFHLKPGNIIFKDTK